MNNKKKQALAVAMSTLLCVTTIQPIMAHESTIPTLQQAPEQQGTPDIEVTPTNNFLLGDSVPTETSVEDIEINETNFPDAEFRDYLKGLSEGGDEKFTSDEIAKITTIGIEGYTSIKDLKGIEYFTALNTLNCSDTGITNLDVSNNTALVKLECSGTGITNLDVSNNKTLTELNCFSTRITGLDVSKNTVLTKLYCFNTPLAYLNIGENNNLTDFDKDNFKEVNLYITEDTFNIKDKFPGIDASKITIDNGANYDNTTGIMTRENKDKAITYTYDCGMLKGVKQEISVTLNTDALEINKENFPDEAFRNYLKGLSEGRDEKFTSSEIADIKLISVDSSAVTDLKGIEFFTALIKLDCSATGITSLDVSKNMSLTELDCFFTGITSLNVSNNTSLTRLNCHNTGITSLNVSNNTVLTYLDCSNTGITKLNVSKNTALTDLYCSNTGIINLDVSENVLLENLSCSYTEITSLDVSKNTELKYLYCLETPLAYLNIGENINLADFDKRNLKPINLNITGDTFNIKEKFPGIDVSKISKVENATFNNTTGIMSEYEIGGTPITYTYDCGTSSKGPEEIKVTLNLTDPRGDSTLSITDSLSKTYDANTVSAIPTVSKSGSTGAISYKWEKKVDDTEWKEMKSLPTDVGTYRVTATLAPDNDYKGIVSSPVEFKISEASNSLTKPLSIKGWTYGKPANEPSATTTFGSVTYLYCYSKDGIYSRIVPTDAGTWYVKVMVEGTDNYESFESTPVSFVIAPMNVLENSQITVPDITVDTDIDKLVIKDGDKALEQGTDYNVTKTQDDKKTTVTITFKRNYTGTITKTYTKEEEVPSGDYNKPEEKVDVPTGDNTQTRLLSTISLLSIGCIAFLTGKKRRKN